MVYLETFLIRLFEQLGTNFTILPNLQILVFFRFVMPNNVPVRSAIPINNLFRLKIPFFSTKNAKAHEKSHEKNFKKVDHPFTLVPASPPPGF